MAGQSRHVWEHSIPPVDAKRYSVTFRTMAGEVNRALRPSVPSVPGGRLLEFVPPAGIDRPWTLMLLVTPSSEPLCIRLLTFQAERNVTRLGASGTSDFGPRAGCNRRDAGAL